MFRSTAAMRCKSQFFACFLMIASASSRCSQRAADERFGEKPHGGLISVAEAMSIGSPQVGSPLLLGNGRGALGFPELGSAPRPDSPADSGRAETKIARRVRALHVACPCLQHAAEPGRTKPKFSVIESLWKPMETSVLSINGRSGFEGSVEGMKTNARAWRLYQRAFGLAWASCSS